jgi:chromosome partitioning protein
MNVSRETFGGVSRLSAPQFDASTPLASELENLTNRRSALANVRVPKPPQTRVFTVANQKGGVGKTTTAVNIAAALAHFGAKVLVIDLDPQGNASTALGIDHHSDITSIYDVVVGGVELASVITPSPENPRLLCAPANLDLAGAEIELVSLAAREYRLKRALDYFLASPSGSDIDYVFIDCPPSLGLLTVNAFVAATEVLIPIQCEYYALEGVTQLVGSIDMIRSHLNRELVLSTILLTMFDQRTNLAHQVVADVRTHFSAQTLNTVIPRSVRVSEAPSYGQTVVAYDRNSPGSVSYQEAAVEIAQRGEAT